MYLVIFEAPASQTLREAAEVVYDEESDDRVGFRFGDLCFQNSRWLLSSTFVEDGWRYWPGTFAGLYYMF